MKYKVAFLFILLPAFAAAQKVSAPDTLIRIVIADLQSSWTLGVDSNSTTVDINMYNKYKSLFDINATIDDDLNFRYIPGKGSGAYKVKNTPKDFDLYAHDVALQVSKLRIDTAIVGPIRTFTRDSITVMIERSAYVEKPKKYVLENIDSLADLILANHPEIKFESLKGTAKNPDIDKMAANLKVQIMNDPDSLYKFNTTSTLRIIMAYTTDSEYPVRIKRIENIANRLVCMNDFDNDAVMDQSDASPREYGEITANGRPDGDLDGVPDAADNCRGTYGSADNKGCPVSHFTTNRQLQGFIGAQMNRPQINLPELNRLGYKDTKGNDAMDVRMSKKGSIKNPGMVAGIFGGGNMSFYLGKNAKKSGISIGITYARFIADFTLGDTMVYTYKANDGTDDYRRQITINKLQEEIIYNVINIPVQFDYRFKPFANNNWVMNMKVGPSLLLFNNKSEYNATIDFGGIYQINPSDGKIVYNDMFAPTTWNVFITSAGINNQNTSPGAAAIFALLRDRSSGYDFAFNKNYRDKQNFSLTTIAYNLSIDGQYKRNKDNPISLKWGAHFMYAPMPERKDKYKPIDKTTDTYNSILNSSAKGQYFVYGINIGLAYSF